MKTYILLAVMFVIVVLQYLEIRQINRRLQHVETLSGLLMAGYKTDRETKEYKQTHENRRSTMD